MTKDGENAAVLMGCLGLIPAMILGFIMKAWAIVTLWGWFITPTWHIAAPPGAVALGVAMLLGTLISSGETCQKDKSAMAIMGGLYIKILLGPIIAVSLGWIVRHWV